MSFNLAAYIDHTILKQTTTLFDIDRVCVEASLENFVAICIPPKYVPNAKKMLDGSLVKVATVIGFPLGYNATDIKVGEIEEAISLGADEVDMVIDLAALKNRDWKHLENEIEACLKPVYAAGKVIKVIVESGILTDDELVACCELYGKYEIDYMKTSTGFADKGASVHAVELMKLHLPKRIGIKASGGIRNFKFAKELIDAGATRLGCTASMQIMKESRGKY
ncbi:MAG: deoxyribose-phosphate aldolase [Chitinophagales bacterium]